MAIAEFKVSEKSLNNGTAKQFQNDVEVTAGHSDSKNNSKESRKIDKLQIFNCYF